MFWDDKKLEEFYVSVKPSGEKGKFSGSPHVCKLLK